MKRGLFVLSTLAVTVCVFVVYQNDQQQPDPNSPAIVQASQWQSSEVTVNTFSSSTQANTACSFDSDGSLVVAWDSRRQQQGTYGVYLQRFAADGQAMGSETQVNLYTQSMQTNPSVASDCFGTWVAWESFGQDGSMGSIIARRFDKSAIVGGDEILVNEVVAGHQSNVAVASDNYGNATFVWLSPTEETGRWVIKFRRFDKDGNALGNERTLHSTERIQKSPTIAGTADNSMIVLWSESDQQGNPTGIFGRLIDSKGELQGEKIAISDGPGIEPSVAGNANGFVAAWMHAGDKDYIVKARAFGLSGRPINSERQVSSTNSRYVSGAAVAVKDSGEYVVSWNEADNSSVKRNIDIHAQFFAADHSPVGTSQVVNQTTDGDQRLTIASGSNRVVWKGDRVAFAWEGKGNQDDSSANLTVLSTRGSSFELVRADSGQLREGSTTESIARPHEPPVFDPKTAARDAFGGDPDPMPQSGAFGFIGITNTGWRPPDPCLAVGPNQIVAMTNGAIAFFDKDGTKTFEDEIEDSFGFWGAQGAQNFVFDPEVLFDPHSNRFFAMACERSGGSSWFLLAVSDDDNPNGTWHKYRFNVTGISDNDIDSPNMAVDAQACYLTADFFGPDKYLVYILDKSDLLVGNAPATTHLLITGSQSYGIPVTYDAGAPAQYMIQAFEFGTFSSVRMHAITDPLGNPQRVTTNVTVPSYGHPADPPQMGSTSRPELFEARFWSCVYRNGSLWAVHHHSPTPSDPARARWYEFDMNGWPVSGNTPFLVQSGEVTPGGNVSTFFPSIWVDAAGNAAITLARSSPTEFFSMSRAVRKSTDPAGTFGPLDFVRQSSDSYTLGRWGDYSGTMSDPASPNTFWGIHEYTPGGNSWNTWIGQYIVEAPVIVTVDGLTVIRGHQAGGVLDDLDASDDSYVVVNAGVPVSPFDPPVSVEIDATSPTDSPTDLTFTLEARANINNVQQAVELFNYDSGQYEEVDSRLATFNDSVAFIEPSGEFTRFVEPGTGAMKARLTWHPNTPPFMALWTVWLDQVVWTITP